MVHDIEKLATEVFNLAAESLSPATRRAYTSDWEQFALWCEARELPAFPAEPLTVCLYLADCQHKLKVASITRALTAISKVHELKGQPSPAKTEAVKTVFSGLRKKHARAQSRAAAVSFADLERMIGLCPPSMIGLRDAALLAVGWGAALRRSEICALDVADLEISELGCKITVRRSKNDQEGRGRVVAIPRAPRSCPVCLVGFIERWVDRLALSLSPGDKDTAVFRKMGSQGRQFFCEVGPRLRDRSVALIVARYAALAGLKGPYSGHSLRRGFATECARAGAPQWAIQQHTGHASADQVLRYIDEGRLFVDSPLLPVLSGARPIAGGGQDL